MPLSTSLLLLLMHHLSKLTFVNTGSASGQALVCPVRTAIPAVAVQSQSEPGQQTASVSPRSALLCVQCELPKRGHTACYDFWRKKITSPFEKPLKKEKTKEKVLGLNYPARAYYTVNQMGRRALPHKYARQLYKCSSIT